MTRGVPASGSDIQMEKEMEEIKVKISNANERLKIPYNKLDKALITYE